MHLTTREERVLAGEEGPGRQKAMELLVALGDIYDAEALVPISSAQVSGASFKTIGEAGVRFLEDFSENARVEVRASVNPLGLDMRRWRSMGIDQEFWEFQKRITDAYSSMALEPLYTCTPYLAGNRPRRGQRVAWAESSATVFANSVLGAYTNREGGPSALAAAIIGKTPAYGLHLEENRLPRVRVDIEDIPPGLVPVAGYVIGKIAGNRIPYIHNLGLSLDEHKAFGAALAATSAVSMYVHSAKGARTRIPLNNIAERVHVPASELVECAEELRGPEDWDLVAIGCPHCSPAELRRMARKLKHRRPTRQSEVWFCTSRHAYKSCPEAVSVLKRFGRVLCDTCMVVAPIEKMFERTASDSGKAMVYLPTLGKQSASFRTTDDLLEAISR